MIFVRKVDVTEPLDGLLKLGRESERAFLRLARPLHKDQIDHARKQTGPDGKWAPRKFNTRMVTKGRWKGRQKRPTKRARKILGRLPSTYRVLRLRRSIVVYSMLDWAGVHQDGNVRVHNGARIPRREFLYASGNFMNEAVTFLGGRMIYVWRQK